MSQARQIRRTALVGSADAAAGPFAQAALDLHSLGLAPIPLGGTDGKVPLVKFGRMKRRPSRETLWKWAREHGQANVGILTGLSRLTVVDIDDAAAVANMIERYGDTPLKVQTPSGGVHLYYRSAGEHSRNLRSEGLSVDVKGVGGVVVVPPSMRLHGTHKGKQYAFLAGDWSELPNLPSIRTGSLNPQHRTNQTQRLVGRLDQRQCIDNVASLRSIIRVGARNGTLFRKLLREARHCDTLDQLEDVAESIRQDHLEHDFQFPFSAAEARRVARSAWRYESEGRNWVGAVAQVVVSASVIDALGDSPDAFLLLAKLRAVHAGRSGPFAIAPKAMQTAAVFPAWSAKRYMKARDILLSRGFIVRVSRGGNGPNDPAQYRFPDRPTR